jgi:DNA-binding MurR/RpiR family transcriptional regulator
MKKTGSSNDQRGATTPEIAFARSALGARLLQLQGEASATSAGIGDFILRNPVRVSAMGINDLAASCAVSAATISRFARALDFANYAAMRGAIAGALQDELSPIEKLRGSIERHTGAAFPAGDSLDYAAANIGATRAGVTAAGLERVVGRIVRARTVYVMGFGLSAHLAAMMVLHLQPFCQQVVDVVAYGGTEVAAGRLMQITERDLLITISFPRYALDAIQLTTFARGRGAAVVVLTDSAASPLSQLADEALLAKSEHAVLPSSSTAAVAMVEAIACSLMVANKKNLARAAELSAAIAPYLYNPRG